MGKKPKEYNLVVQMGWIFDIQRYSINDGPGIRTTVFFKGCPLRCIWCDNPESQKPFPELFHLSSLCVRCYRCVDSCPTGATTIGSEGEIKIKRELCKVCGECVKACLSEARVISGKSMGVEEVLKVVKSDTLFYRNSGGGVTASGGEPTCQPDFLLDLLKRCQESGIHTTLDTCGHAQWDVLEKILEYVDLVLFDIKHMDSVRHKELTGVDSGLILENARRIAQKGKSMIVRVPLIPWCNDSEENIKALGNFVTETGLLRVDLLPYHQLGSRKYEQLGMKYKLSEIESFKEEEVQVIKNKLESRGLTVSVA